MTREQRKESDILWNQYKEASANSKHYFKRYMACKTEKAKEKNWELMKLEDEKKKRIWEDLKPYHEMMIEDEKRIKAFIESIEGN